MQEHRFIRFMSEGDKGYQEEYGAKDVEMYQKFLDDVYDQTDRYLGRFVHLLDEGWTIIITSDHAQVCPAHKPPLIGDMGVNVRVMEELGYAWHGYAPSLPPPHWLFASAGASPLPRCRAIP